MSDEKLSPSNPLENYEGLLIPDAKWHITASPNIGYTTINLGQPDKVMVITVDKTVEFYDDKGEMYLEITPEGFAYRGDKVSVGKAGAKFAAWVEQMCHFNGGK
jgi:hypothetical protein